MQIVDARIERKPLKECYVVRNYGYPPRKANIDGLSRHLAERTKACCTGNRQTVHFVTHSLGGIVVRYYLEKYEQNNLGRVVMLSPPNSGSELADLLNDIPLVNRHTSESRLQLGTTGGSIPSQLGPADYELGIIAGDRSLITGSQHSKSLRLAGHACRSSLAAGRASATRLVFSVSSR